MGEPTVRAVLRTPQFWWRVAIVFACALGLMSGERRLAYFTTQSNVIVVAYFAVAVFWMLRRRRTDAPAPVLRGGVTLWIVITGLVSHVLLNQGASPFPGMADPDAAVALANQSLFILHYAVPAMVLLDWVLFPPHGMVRWRDAGWWMLYPVAYGAITLVRAAVFPTVSDRFPYPFLDYVDLGAGVVVSLLRVVAVMAVLAVGVVALDKLAAAFTRRRVDERRYDADERPRDADEAPDAVSV
ncbi:hypothetical protein JOD63_001518 [Microbacterium terrae]|uniref:FAR-17a/AIG1-like protein n=1 Tax=Microbacterium terrae TaxID=69369 RepID=A0A0M2H3M9_9MICO|nr:Pr6Pr family membrane protein [Microbacterium terrae]KJL38137.1 hypothetical protein RS81_03135 [Microbacterium terrae]MBP1077550.1 hypothetical protein [Microbacterium terrae]GLJ99155.1 hypothetical protein GCM10017594_23520 [Microbacterium terrae]